MATVGTIFEKLGRMVLLTNNDICAHSHTELWIPTSDITILKSITSNIRVSYSFKVGGSAPETVQILIKAMKNSEVVVIVSSIHQAATHDKMEF